MRHSILATVALAAGLTARPARALDPATAIAQFNQRVWGLDEGLPQATVRAIAQTPDGYLWIGTDGGLARFDGVRFTVYSVENTPALRNHQVRGLVVDRAGDLWIATHGRPGILRHRRGVFETFEDQMGTRDPIFISAFADRRDRLWFGTWWGVFRVEAGRLTWVERTSGRALGSVRGGVQDRDGGVWLATYGPTWHSDGGAWQPIESLDGAPVAPAHALLAEADGTLWVGTDRGLTRRRAGEARLFSRRDGLASDNVRALLRDRDGNLWVGTTAGLSRMRGERFESDAPPPGLFGQGVSVLFEDREGNLWLGASPAGLVRLRDGPFVSPLPPGRTGPPGTAIRGTPDGTVWIGTGGGGLLRVRGAETSWITSADGLCTDRVRTLEVDRRGRLWVGGDGTSHHNLCRQDGAGFRTFTRAEGLAGYTAVRSLVQGREQFWVATEQQLFRLDEEGDRLVAEPLPPPDRPADKRLLTLREDRQGRLWIGATDALLHRPARDGLPWDRVDARQGLPREWIYELYEDAGGVLWIGTGAGFSRLAAGKLINFGVARGFFDDDVYGIAEDAERALWLCSPRGVFRVPRAELEAVDRGRRSRIAYVVYRAGDGLGTNSCAGGLGNATVWKAPDGRLWFPTERGAAYLDPRKLVRSAPLPPLVVDAISFDGRAVGGGALAALGPGRGELSFSYAALTYTAPEKVRYRHRLEPLETELVEGKADVPAHYLQVPPGAYRFRVVANLDGMPGRDVTAVLALRVLPHVWERWWFRVAGALALAGLGAALVSVRNRARLARLEEGHQLVIAERTRMARELHDTFSQAFTALAVQLEAANRRLETAPEKARQNLDEARMLVRNSLTDARGAIWDLRPQALEGRDVGSALSEIATRLGAEAPVRVRIEGHPRRLAEPLEIALVRIGQEALTNALKHARARSIELTVHYGESEIALRVSDDGAGFDADGRGAVSSQAGHFGLRGIKERVAAVGGRLTVRSRPGQGTEIAVEVPAP